MGWTRKSAAVSVLLAMEDHRKQVGVRVLRLREARKWTHEDLAHAAGLSVKTVSRVEKGKHEGRRTTIRKLADALDVTETELIGEPPSSPILDQRQEPSQLASIEQKLDAILTLLTATRPDALTRLQDSFEALPEAAEEAPRPAVRKARRAQR